MNTLNCQPVIFGPGIIPHCPAAPWYHVTAVRLGWWIVAIIVAAWLIAAVSSWIGDRWEHVCGRPRVNRRWYGSGSIVRNRDSALDGRYRVLTWCDEYTPVPWLLLEELSDDEYADPLTFWGPVTSYASVMVRRFRPRLVPFGAHRRASLTDYRMLPGATAIWRGES